MQPVIQLPENYTPISIPAPEPVPDLGNFLSEIEKPIQES